PTNATDTTSLSTYLYARANPLTYTDPDGREPIAGTATVYWNGLHGYISVDVNGKVVTTSRSPELNGNNTVTDNYKNAKYYVEAYKVPVPDGLAAQAEQAAAVSRGVGGDGRYRPFTDDCLTHVGNVLRAGKVPNVPENSKKFALWLRTGGGGSRSAQRGSATLGTMLGIASIGILVADLYNDPSLENVLRISKGLGGYAALDAVAISVIGRTVSGPLFLFGGMRSDNAKFNEEQERRDLIEQMKRGIDDRASIYFDKTPGVTMNQARAHVIGTMLGAQNN
ncbi:hypothetical protein ACIBBG_34375, partial [Micromonospora chersina]|uniref:hypothetical protein n=1 Tax=Micromonospora chersina TaxID=47854 RepID=UPI0037940C63